MRFRLATSGAGGGGQELAGGVGNLFRSIAMAPALAAQAQQEAMDAQAVRDLRGAQMRAADASASLDAAKAADVTDQRERGTIGAVLRNAAMVQGVAPAQQGDLVSYLQTGQMPGQYTPAPDGMGPVLPTPAMFTDGTAQKVMRTAGIANQALAQGDKNVENLWKALGLQRGMDLGDAVLSGQRDAASVGQAQAAMEGKKLVDAIGNTGMGYNLFTGQGQQVDPGLRAIFGDEAAAKIEADKARAGASRASAASSYASAAKTRAEMELGSKGSLQQTDQGLLLVDPRTAQARPVIGPDGKPAGAKPSAGANNISEGERKAATLLARLRGSQAQLQAALEESPSAAKPGMAAEAVRAVPWIGGDTPANMITGETRQRIEAAQLDMLDAALTLGTGAAYTKEQLRGYAKSFFPQIGDGPKTVEDKKERLANVIRSAEIAAGRAEPQVQKPVMRPTKGGASSSWGDDAGWSIQRVE